MRNAHHVALLFCSLAALPVSGQDNRPPRVVRPETTEADDNEVSPARRIRRQDAPPPTGAFGGPLRSIDGTGNNLAAPEMGSVGTPLARWVAAEYDDGAASLAGADRPGARLVSNTVSAQEGSRENPLGATDYLWQWGQFLDHDIDLTDGTDPPEPVAIPVPAGDPFFDPQGTGAATIAFNRSIYDVTTGTEADNPRQQLNEITSWIDASNVYGSDAQRAAALRTNDGTGRLKTSDGELLPFNTEGLPNAGGDSPALFLAGDVRANEQIGLTALHTLFVREHNRLAGRIAQQDPELDGEEIYQRARALVAAEMQVITYREYLPALLGQGALAPYRGYEPEVDASIANLFSTACYRYGHSALSPTLQRLAQDGSEIPEGSLALRDAFFSPTRIVDEGGIEPLLRGLAAQACQELDPYLIDDVRNFLFGPPGSGGFDLASLNIQRGRDHGLPDYNAARVSLGLAPATTFADVSSDPKIQERLAAAYDRVGSIDLWVGALAEDPVAGSHVGELNQTVFKAQFEALRDGDRFWYERSLDEDALRLVESTRLSDVIRRNTTIGDELQGNVFRVPGAGGPPPAPGAPVATRGDVNADGTFDIADPVATLGFLFLGMPEPQRLQAADVTTDGEVDIGDVVRMLGMLFGSTEP